MNTDNLLMDIENSTAAVDTEPVPGIGKPEINKEHLKKDEWLKVRFWTQTGFFVLILYIGWEFVVFVNKMAMGAPADLSQRPPGVEGFLPISSMMELLLWVKTGLAPAIHPAGVVIFSFAIGSALFIKRGFCSWFCPVGYISELLSRLGVKMHVSIKPWKWIDYPLRSLKYIILAFFVYAILLMPLNALYLFITGDYNLVSDVKMLNLFSFDDRMTWSVFGILALLTLLIKNFWCRYLCPYGALLGIFSMASPVAIRRNASTCIDCGLCDKACPSFLPVATKNSIKSAECLACQQCTAVCPVVDCLQLSTPKKRLVLKPSLYAMLFAGLFFGSVVVAKIAGYWQTTTDVETYRELTIKSESLSHPRDLKGYK